VAHSCNLNCAYCDVNKGKYTNEEYMSPATAKKAIDFLISNTTTNKLIIIFYGGEPLLNFSTIKEAVKYCKACHVNYSFDFQIHTNGVLLNEQMCKFFSDNNSTVTVSIDGPQNIHDKYRVNLNGNGSYTKISNNMKMLRDYNVKTNITCVVNKIDRTDIAELYTYLRDTFTFVNLITIKHEKSSYANVATNELVSDFLRIDKIQGTDNNSGYTHCIPSQVMRALIYKILFIPSQDHYVCPQGNRWISVTPNGDIYLCQHSIMYNNFVNNEFMAGNINKTFKPEQLLKTTNYIMQKCQDCSLYNLCSNRGCHLARALNKEPFPWQCELTSRQVTELIEYLSTTSYKRILDLSLKEHEKQIKIGIMAVRTKLKHIKPLAVKGCDRCASTTTKNL
ncbi:MAG: radical SAM protein, partial [Planctomycetes bacterium]|nr:radical SAM protein [Planctomycetota bacterium]